MISDLLSNPQFWTIVISVAALFLSQLPPIRQMIKGKKLRLATARRVQLFHVFGNTNMNLWLDLENVGGRDITVRKIQCILVQREGFRHALLAESYWLTESLGRERALELPLSEIPLRPNERWSGYLHFFDANSLTKEIQARQKNAIIGIKDDIEKKLRTQQLVPTSAPSLVEAEPSLVQETVDIIRTIRKLQLGDYEMFLVVYEDTNNTTIGLLGFDLTLFEKDIREIFEDVLDYKYGFGIYLPPRRPVNVWIEIRSKDKEESQKRFNTLRI